MAKAVVGSVKKKLAIDMPDIEVMQIYSVINILLKYNWHLDPIDNKTAVDLGLQNIKNTKDVRFK